METPERIVMNFRIGRKRESLSRILTAVLLLLTGCSSSYQTVLQGEQLSKDEGKVASQILKTGKKVVFNYEGGRVRYNSARISGILEDGTPVRIPLTLIRELHTSRPASHDFSPGLISSIKEIELTNNILVRPDTAGFIYNQKTGGITGRTNDGQFFSTSPAMIRKVYITAADTAPLEKIINQGERNVKRVLVLPDNRLYTLNDQGISISESGLTVEGITESGRYHTINISDVSSAVIIEESGMPDVLFYSGVTLGVLTLIYLAGSSGALLPDGIF
ncbi:MAG: hypothetical protein L6Q47_08495 [Ignavibacteriaceae bacterium]|nr:hypothetical protein [Ignavibacteriaceae bacterium]